MKRAERRHRTRCIVERRKFVLAWSWGLYEDDRTIRRRIASCKKKAPNDCGRSRCLVCHSEKIFSIVPFKQTAYDLSYKEWLSELEKQDRIHGRIRNHSPQRGGSDTKEWKISKAQRLAGAAKMTYDEQLREVGHNP